MRKNILLVILISLTIQGFGQFKLNDWVDEIKYEDPKSDNWIQISKFPAQLLLKGTLKFKHKPIKDSLLGLEIEPVIALLYEEGIDTMDLIAYSIEVLSKKPYKINYKLLGGFPEYSSEKVSVVYEGFYYNQRIKHRLIIGYLLHNDLVIELICDGTEGIFEKVENDFFRFIKSVRVVD